MKRSVPAMLSVLALTIGAAGLAQAENYKSSNLHNGKVRATETREPLQQRSSARNEKEFRMELAGPGMVSLLASQIALEKTTDDKIREFAMFEANEQKTIKMIFDEMNTPRPVLSNKDRMMVDKLKSLPAGPEFDRAYIKGSLKTHMVLQDITETYLSHAGMNNSDMRETHVRHLAMLMLGTIKQHVANSKMLLNKLD